MHDPELRSLVEALLSSDENAGNFLSQRAMDHVKAEAAEAYNNTPPSPCPAEHPVPVPPSAEFSKRFVGRYQIVREIGHGGMGTVYLAERADGQYRKQVAIKVVNPQFGAGEILRHFRSEVQIVAPLEHSNIARSWMQVRPKIVSRI